MTTQLNRKQYYSGQFGTEIHIQNNTKIVRTSKIFLEEQKMSPNLGVNKMFFYIDWEEWDNILMQQIINDMAYLYPKIIDSVLKLTTSTTNFKVLNVINEKEDNKNKEYFINGISFISKKCAVLYDVETSELTFEHEDENSFENLLEICRAMIRDAHQISGKLRGKNFFINFNSSGLSNTLDLSIKKKEGTFPSRSLSRFIDMVEVQDTKKNKKDNCGPDLGKDFLKDYYFNASEEYSLSKDRHKSDYSDAVEEAMQRSIDDEVQGDLFIEC